MKNANIVLGVSGGIAAYKAVLLARALIEAGHKLHVVPTEDALRFVGKPTWEAISRNPVTTSVHEDVPEVRHVALGQRADLIIVAPATANTIAKMAAGLADDLLGTTLLASRAPVLLAPAMHTEMWQHSSTTHNIAVLRERGVQIIGPDSGRLTGDDSGPGRMSEPEEIARVASQMLECLARGVDVASSGGAVGGGGAVSQSTQAHGEQSQHRNDFTGKRVLVTAGGTREAIDPVRYIGNRSSGQQGIAVALAAADRGAHVELVAANISEHLLGDLRGNAGITITEVVSTVELKEATDRLAAVSDVIFMVAAVSDYRVANSSDEKLRKSASGSDKLTLELVENPDILRGLVDSRIAGKAPAGQIIAGFAAETGADLSEVLAHGAAKIKRKGTDLLAVNQVGAHKGFETPDNRLTVLAPSGETVVDAAGSKREVSEALLDAILTVDAGNGNDQSDEEE